MTKITLTRLTELAAEKSARDAQARIAELEAEVAEWRRQALYHNAEHGKLVVIQCDMEARSDKMESNLREILTDATSREHALTIAREGLE